jgi:hypothetical protein
VVRELHGVERKQVRPQKTVERESKAGSGAVDPGMSVQHAEC